MEEKLKEIQIKLNERLKSSGWSNKLRMFILSDEFYNILCTLAEQSNQGKKFTPTIKHLFRAFEECPYGQLKVVIIGQDPYPREGAADGIAFSCSHAELPSQIQPSLRTIHKALTEEGIEHDHQHDLAKWSNQGILMLNTALTTQIGIPGVHTKIWEPFMKYLFDVLGSETNVVYVLMGKTAQRWRSYIDEDLNFVFTCSHPAHAAYSQGNWYSNGVFKRTTDTVKKYHNYDIIW